MLEKTWKLLSSPDNIRYKITSFTFSLTAKTTQNYNTHKYPTTLSSAIIHTILTVKIMICVPEISLLLPLHSASYNKIVKQSRSHTS